MGKLYTKQNTFQRRMPLLVGLCGGIGGILPDIDHFISLATGHWIGWCEVLHYAGWIAFSMLIFGLLITFGSRQIATLVLADKTAQWIKQ